MERQNPFSEALFWKRMIGLGLVLGGIGAAVITLGWGGEVIDGLDAVILIVETLSAGGGLGLLLSPDPARL